MSPWFSLPSRVTLHALVATCVLTLVAGAALGVALAQSVQLNASLPVSHKQEERFKMSVGVTGVGRPLIKPTDFVETRDVICIPAHYGALLEITPHGDHVVFWFQDPQGLMRNAVVERVKDVPYAIQKCVTTNVELEAEKQSRPR